MGATVCFYFDESTSSDVEPGRANEWYRLAENWKVDALVIIDETRESGRHWFENLVPAQPVKIPVRRFKKFEELADECPSQFVYIERAERRPSRLCERTVGLYRYEHRETAT